MFDLIKLLVGLLFPYLILSLICMLIVEFYARATNLSSSNTCAFDTGDAGESTFGI
jgi:hypothetical protein